MAVTWKLCMMSKISWIEIKLKKIRLFFHDSQKTIFRKNGSTAKSSLTRLYHDNRYNFVQNNILCRSQIKTMYFWGSNHFWPRQCPTKIVYEDTKLIKRFVYKIQIFEYCQNVMENTMDKLMIQNDVYTFR